VAGGQAADEPCPLTPRARPATVAGAEQTRPDANLYFVGARGSGKSTLLNRILYPNETATPKPTDGVEYSYLRKSAPNSDRKDVANIWEISGADELCADFTASENLFLGMRQVSVTSLCSISQLHKPPPPPTSAWQNSVYQHLWESGRPRADDAFAFARRLGWEMCHSGAHLLYLTYGEHATLPRHLYCAFAPDKRRGAGVATPGRGRREWELKGRSLVHGASTAL